jgi:hypothetical protein
MEGREGGVREHLEDLGFSVRARVRRPSSRSSKAAPDFSTSKASRTRNARSKEGGVFMQATGRLRPRSFQPPWGIFKKKVKLVGFPNLKKIKMKMKSHMPEKCAIQAAATAY